MNQLFAVNSNGPGAIRFYVTYDAVGQWHRWGDCRHEQRGREMKVAQGHLKRWAWEDDDRPLEDVL